MDWNNQFSSIGFQGSAIANGNPKVYREGFVTVGGVNADTVNIPFGVIVSAAAATPNQFKIGAGAAICRGIVLFNPAFAQNDPAKNSYYLPGQVLASMLKGQVTITSWTKTATGAIDPVIGCVVIYNNTTGIIEFLAAGSSAPSGWTALAADVYDVGNALGTGTGILASGVGVSLSLRLI